MKSKKIYLTILLALVLLIVSGCARHPDFSADALFFVETVEITHPIFGFPDMLADDYEDVRRIFLESAAQAECQIEFAFALKRYIRVLQDGHMSRAHWLGHWFGDWFTDINWDVRDDGLFFLEYLGAVGTEVSKIGDIPVSDIFTVIETYFYFENEACRRITLSAMSRNREFHARAGVDVNENILITLIDGNEIVAYYQDITQPRDQEYPSYIIRYEMMGDVFFISLRQMQFCQLSHNQTLEAVRNALGEGTRHFIVDVRGNPGGDSDVGDSILQAMGLDTPRHGIYRRMSPLAREQRLPSAGREDGTIWLQMSPNTALSYNRNDVVVAILTDNISYSSATWMAALVQDGDFGVVVGEPSSNSPSMFGDMLLFTLPNTGIEMYASWSRFLRPDVNADQQTLLPDIPVEARHALDAALEFFGVDAEAVNGGEK